MPFAERWDEFLQKGLFLAPMLFAMGIGGGLALLKKANEKSILPILYMAPVFLFLLWTGDFFPALPDSTPSRAGSWRCHGGRSGI